MRDFVVHLTMMTSKLIKLNVSDARITNIQFCFIHHRLQMETLTSKRHMQ